MTEEKGPNQIIEIHPAASVFPLMSDEDIASLADSISEHGLREKIHVLRTVRDSTPVYTVIDGRNRLEALRRHHGMTDDQLVEHSFVKVNLGTMGATPAEYVMMANIERRNLTQAQRRDLAGKLVLMIQEEQKNKPKSEKVDALSAAAEKAGVSRSTAATAAKKIKPKKPSTTPAQKKDMVPGTARPASVLAKLEGAVEGVKVVKFLEKWDTQHLIAANKMSEDIKTLITFELNRRVEAERENLAELEKLALDNNSDES